MAIRPKGDEQPKKRKHPPTFQHLPRNRAQKLKQQWVEKTKLKSQWKTQKRKQGLHSGWNRPAIALPQDDVQETQASDAEDEHRSQEESSHDDADGRSSDHSTSSDSESEHPEPGPEPEPVPKKARLEPRARPSTKSSAGKRPIQSAGTSSRNRDDDDDDEGESEGKPQDEKPSLRELSRRAYSRETLHTFKADPLHKRKGTLLARQTNYSGRGERTAPGGKTVRGYQGGSLPGRGRGWEGRGQPNMKLRMEVMLERIKRDFS